MQNKENAFWGIILLVIGILFLGNNLDWWNINIFFEGWWTLFIIIPSLRGLIEKETRACSFITLLLGILMLLASRNVINWSMLWKILIPTIIIVIGLSLIMETIKNEKKISDKNFPKYIAVFGGIEEQIKEIVNDFKAIAVFGGMELDLSKSKLKKDITINAISIFGGIDLKLPENVKVVSNGVPIFGGIENKYKEEKEANITIHINYTCIFGGIDIL